MVPDQSHNFKLLVVYKAHGIYQAEGSTRSGMPFSENKIFLRFYVYIVMWSDLALFASWTDTLLFINTRGKSLWGKVRHFLECTNPSDSLWSYNKQIIDQICFPFLSWYYFLEIRFNLSNLFKWNLHKEPRLYFHGLSRVTTSTEYFLEFLR